MLPLIAFYPPQVKGLEGECADQREAKTVRWTAFNERIAESNSSEHAASIEDDCFVSRNGCYLHQNYLKCPKMT